MTRKVLAIELELERNRGYERPVTAQESVVRELRRLIATRELKPGQRVHQSSIAERLGVSRVPVREALKVLQAEGQVIYEPRRGYRVRALSLDELEELYLLRSLLESEAMRHAVPRIGPDDVAHLKRVLAALERAEDDGDMERVATLNREFHLSLFEVARLPRLFKYISLLWQNSEPYRSFFFREPAWRRRVRGEHRRLMRAIANHETDSAIELMDQHRQNAVDELVSLLEASDRDARAPTTTG